MTELVRGLIADRPWGLTFGQLGLREVTGQLTVHAADGREYKVAFEGGAIVGATSPQPADAVTRIAMTSGLISSSQVATIAKQIAATPEIDDIALLASAARLTPEQIAKLRRRVISQRAARTFSVESGSFVVDDTIQIPIAPDAAVDVRAVVLQGARMNLSELRLVAELRALGSHFTIGETALDHSEWFGISAQEMPILVALRMGATLPELEAKHREIDPRSIQSVLYALVSCNECEVAGPSPRAKTPSQEPVSVSFRGAADPSIPKSVTPAGSGAVTVPRTETVKGSTASQLVPPANAVPEMSAEEEFRTATGTRTGQPPTRKPFTDESVPLAKPRNASPSIPPPDPAPRPTDATDSARIKSPTAPWPRPKATTSPPLTRSNSPTNPPINRPRTTSQSGAMPKAAVSEGSDRENQSYDGAADAFRRGMEALQANQLPAAVEQLTRASTLNPHEFEHTAMLAYAHVFAALPGDRPKLADKARKMLSHMTQKSRDPIQAMVYLGLLERLLGNDKQAVVHFRSALAANPEHRQAAIELQQIEDKALEKSGFGLFKKK